MRRLKIVIDHDEFADFSWLEQAQYDPRSPRYDPIYPTIEDLRAKTNAYDGNWYRNPENHVALDMIVYVIDDDDQDWRAIGSLGNIDFLIDESDWVVGTFYSVDAIPATCQYLRDTAIELIADAEDRRLA